MRRGAGTSVGRESSAGTSSGAHALVRRFEEGLTSKHDENGVHDGRDEGIEVMKRAFTEDWHMDYGRCIFTANGEMQAQQVRAFLDAAGIPSDVRGESLRKTHGLTLDGLGRVEVIVSDVDEARARALLAEAEDGAFRLDDDADVGLS